MYASIIPLTRKLTHPHAAVNDPQWEKKYLASFQGANLQKSKFLVTSGNHDYYGNVTAQVDYVDPTKRWTFPQLYHARRFEQNGIKVLFIMLDTWRLNGGDALLGHNAATGRTWIRSRAQIWKKVEQGDLAKESAERLEKRYGAPMLGEESAAAARGDVEQLNWLRKVFASKEAVESDWRIVCGHFPIHSGTKGEHGDTKYLVQTLDPLLHELGADAYFSGHDHVLQMINKGKKLHYYGPGAGARKHALMNTKYAGLLGHAEGVLGFMKHTLTKTEMTTTIVDEHAKEVFKYVQHKNKKHQLEENVAVA